MIQTFTITLTQKEVLKTLIYFDVFNYPLKSDEVFENFPMAISKEILHTDLEHLTEEGFIKYIDGFYLLTSSSGHNIEKRLQGNAFAQKVLPKAYEYSKKIARFPFMSGICISGGLSKNYYDENSDIDYFVITKPDRLWICRSIFTLYYKTLSKEKKQFYCLNYFISESDLIIPDKNVFVARELAHLIPTINYSVYKTILEKNNWYKESFQNKSLIAESNCTKTPEPFIKKLTERIFAGNFGNMIDNWLLKITLQHWRKKYPEMSKEDFDLQLRSRKHVCKYHTKGHQNKVLTIWNEKIAQFEKAFDINLR